MHTASTIAQDCQNRDTTIAAIKAALKARSAIRWSVRGGTGTVWGWIDVTTVPSLRPDGSSQMAEGHVAELLTLIGIKEHSHWSIPASRAHRLEALERAWGLPVTKVAEAYWD